MNAKILLISLLTFIFATATVLADAQSDLEQADNYYKAGQYSQAEQSYQNILTEYPDTDYALQAQKGLTLVYISTDKLEQAKASYQELITDYATYSLLPAAVYEVGEKYREKQKYNLSADAHRYIVTNFPSSERAIWAQRSIAASYIALGNTRKAEKEKNNLISIYSEDPNLDKAILEVGCTYYWFKFYSEADQLFDYILENWPEGEQALWANMNLAISSIVQDKDSYALSIRDKLINDFNDDPNLPEALFQIAGRFEWSKKYDNATSIFQDIVDDFPESQQASNANFALEKIDVFRLFDEGKPGQCLSSVDDFIDDFNSHPALYWVISRDLAERRYYQKAFELKAQNLEQQAEDYFYDAITVWGKVVNDIGEESEIPYAYNWIADSYHQIGDYNDSKQYYQMIVDNYPDFEFTWHAQFMVGRNYENLKKTGAISESEADLYIKAAYEQLLEEYPNCKAAKIADRWLVSHNFK